MQELFLARWVEMGHCSYCFHNLKKQGYHINSLKEKETKHNLCKLAQVFCSLLSLLSKYFGAKIKCIRVTLTESSSQPLFGLVTQCPLFPVRERHCVTKVAKETLYTAVPLTEKKSKLFICS